MKEIYAKISFEIEELPKRTCDMARVWVFMHLIRFLIKRLIRPLEEYKVR